MNNTQKNLIREVFLRNGFTIKDGRDDLADYVYAAAHDLLQAVPAVQREPIAWSGWGCQHPGKMPRLYGERRIAELNCDWENGDQVLYFTATLQPTEQPDVTQLVEALEELIDLMEDIRQGEYVPDSFTTQPARIALVAHRKQGGE